MKKIVREVWSQVTLPVTLVAGLSAIALLVLSGPFGTYSGMTFGARALYWTTVVLVSLPLALTVRDCVCGVLSPKASFFRREATTGLLFSAIFTWPLHSLTHVLVDGRHIVMEPKRMFIGVLAVCACVSSVRYTLGADGKEEDVQPRLLSRIDGHPGASVTRMTVDDHYVEVFLADGGHHRLLMRFSDAVAELDGIRGFCVHRSHWVALDAIDEVFREKGRDLVRMKDGAIVPVSRTYRPNLVDAGFLEDTAVAVREVA